jgi:NAD(P)-dependent dehydrogenase (short-subunit alcohol dehydrogenase family)
VNTLSPGPTDTAMFGRFPGKEQGEAVKDVLRTNNPSKRMANPLEIAKLAVYLASDDSAYVVGADFLIDGALQRVEAAPGAIATDMLDRSTGQSQDA